MLQQQFQLDNMQAQEIARLKITQFKAIRSPSSVNNGYFFTILLNLFLIFN